jgi:N-acetylglucosaminyldiphosphoundecaprenol N-acetyl-beta-D-mannosaminyltransferase
VEFGFPMSNPTHDLVLEPAIPVLGTPLVPTTYDALIGRLRARPKDASAVALSFVNTQIVSMRRADPAFHSATAGIDCFLPDGMPLVWCMNRAGAGLRDRVFGPEFMRRALAAETGSQTHYLLGGSAECGDRLRQRAAVEWPAVRFVGSYHGRCAEDGRLGASGAEEDFVFRELRQLRPDWIWIGMGEGRQNALLARIRKEFNFGVWLGVGCALDMLAGLQKVPPAWMQRTGLSWLYRWWQEPRRLTGRYLKYNTQFLVQLLIAAVLPDPERPPD